MVKEVSPDLFCIQIPLPDSPLKNLNAYLVRSHDRHLLIDTGLNHKECLQAMEDGLQAIGVDLVDTDIFITHFHADHFSLVPKLLTPSTRVYFNRSDAEQVEHWTGFDTLIKHAERHGFPSRQLKSLFDEHPAAKFGSDWAPDFQLLDDGQKLNVGDYQFECIETPGHTLGHTCLYEADKKILVSGDHILIDITPNIQCWQEGRNPLKSYMESLKKTLDLDVELVLPGHRRIFKDHRPRVKELISHHEQRLMEVLAILKKGAMTGYETASCMSWDIRADSWDAFPVAQQWFATGEAISHLRYLEEDGSIFRRSDAESGVVKFELA